MKGKQPQTSLEAYHSLDPDNLSNLRDWIVDALKVIKQGTSEEIATHLKLDHGKIWKRISETVKEGRIVNTGAKKQNKSGRNAFIYSLPNSEEVFTPVEKIPKGNTISHFSRNIDKIGTGEQASLF